MDDEEEDSNVSTELSVITAENDPYDDQVSGQEWNFLFDDSNDEDDEFNGMDFNKVVLLALFYCCLRYVLLVTGNTCFCDQDCCFLVQSYICPIS